MSSIIFTQTDTLILKNGWRFRNLKDSVYYRAEVPGTVHTDLLNNNLIDDPFYRDNEKKLQWIEKEDWVYETTFNPGCDLDEIDEAELIFEGLDTYADIYLNGIKISESSNMFTGLRVKCKNILQSESNELKIIFYSPYNRALTEYLKLPYILPAGNDQAEKKVSVFARKAPYHFGWDWGPRFVTSGIFRPVKLLLIRKINLIDVNIVIKKLSEKEAILSTEYEIEAYNQVETDFKVFINDETTEHFSKKITLVKGINSVKHEFRIENPKLWWCNGLGDPYLYKVITKIFNDDGELFSGEIFKGLRTLEIINDEDKWGESFYVKLNGIPVFMKGANYIPSDNFVSRVTKEKYEHLIKSAVEANMNMIRVWGGGLYEDDYFYELCDKNGILIFQDFMFACSMYPGDKKFLENVKSEAEYNIKRLRNYACIALWCGNNEIAEAWHNWGWQKNFGYTEKQKEEIWGNYNIIFHEILPEAIRSLDSSRFYWPSSPKFGWADKKGKGRGDMHYWGVWHGEEQFESYRLNIGRFMSEYGFQSFPSFNSVKKYSLPVDWYISSDVMKSHQKHPRGNQLIEKYIRYYYKEPKNFYDFLYISQVLQAEGIKLAIESHRSQMPYCMGTLYWQLNDCWPVASWSGIDYYGEWKALHYFVKKAFSNCLISPVYEDNKIKVMVINDYPYNKEAKIKLRLMDFMGNIKWYKEELVTIKAGISQKYFEIKEKEILKGLDKNEIFLDTRLIIEGKEESRNNLYFVNPADMNLPYVDIKYQVRAEADFYIIEITSDKLVKNLFLEMDVFEGHFSDNYFDLNPGEIKTIRLKTKEKIFNIGDLIKIKSLNNIYR